MGKYGINLTLVKFTIISIQGDYTLHDKHLKKSNIDLRKSINPPMRDIQE